MPNNRGRREELRAAVFIRCRKHKSYKALRAPTARCETCKYIWDLCNEENVALDHNMDFFDGSTMEIFFPPETTVFRIRV